MIREVLGTVSVDMLPPSLASEFPNQFWLEIGPPREKRRKGTRKVSLIVKNQFYGWDNVQREHVLYPGDTMLVTDASGGTVFVGSESCGFRTIYINDYKGRFKSYDLMQYLDKYSRVCLGETDELKKEMGDRKDE